MVLPKMKTVGLKEKNDEIFARANRKAHKLTWIAMLLIDLMMVTWMPAPFINRILRERKNETQYDIVDRRWLDFCYVTWFPYDITVSPYYEIIYILQVVIFVVATGYMKSLDLTMISMLVHISAQFEILYTALQDMDAILASILHKTNNPKLHEDNVIAPLMLEDVSDFKLMPRSSHKEDELTIMEDSPEMRDYFVKFIEYHQSVLRKTQNRFAGPLIIICFFMSQFLGCVTTFQMALEWSQGNKDTKFIKYIFSFLGVTCIPFIYCWYGTAVMHNGLLIQRAAFECQWYRRSETFKHHLIMVIMRTQKPVYVSGRQFYKLSLQTFGEMMNTMYAYFTLLKNLYED
ncbi:hypothetical protein L9F63_021767 [Diploptera punctata]|uniref:Odorant receptor n=1 Tax=Diploptera punctata TaxID=6984 RepID=A0AAD7ZNW4_DIPPU|nr:hypothetical protein L9F63_021767 [Diploptera punctata]